MPADALLQSARSINTPRIHPGSPRSRQNTCDSSLAVRETYTARSFSRGKESRSKGGCFCTTKGRCERAILRGVTGEQGLGWMGCRFLGSFHGSVARGCRGSGSGSWSRGEVAVMHFLCRGLDRLPSSLPWFGRPQRCSRPAMSALHRLLPLATRHRDTRYLPLVALHFKIRKIDLGAYWHTVRGGAFERADELAAHRSHGDKCKRIETEAEGARHDVISLPRRHTRRGNGLKTLPNG